MSTTTASSRCWSSWHTWVRKSTHVWPRWAPLPEAAMRNPESARHVRGPAPWRAAAALFCLALALPVGAQQIDYDPRRAAVLKRCDEPAWALGDLRNANDFFREAVAAEPRASLPRVRWGRMFLAAGQYTDAERLFAEALEIGDKDLGALLAQTRLMAERFEGDLSPRLAALQAENPDLIETQLINAGIAIEGGDLAAAGRAAQRALTLTEQQKQPPLEAHTLLAAIEVVRNRDPAQWTRAALA